MTEEERFRKIIEFRDLMIKGEEDSKERINRSSGEILSYYRGRWEMYREVREWITENLL